MAQTPPVQTSLGRSSALDSIEKPIAPMPSSTQPGIPTVVPDQVAGGITYQVHILGEVVKPGTYRMPASTRLSEALDRAGGALERGSIRKIQLKRESGDRLVDLLSFREGGNLDSNPYLLDNDVIFVPLRNNIVQVEGSIRRPGTYELKNERNIEDLFKLVGGGTPGFEAKAPLKVIRFNEEGKRKIIEVENSIQARKSFLLENGDVIIFPHILTKDKKFDYNLAKLPGDNVLFYPSYDDSVSVLGAVNKSGPYPFSPYYEVRQYLTLAGGTTRLAKLRKIKIINSDGMTKRASNTTKVNPGDTIIVPERYLAPESFITLVLSVSASIIGITTAIITLKK